MKNRWRMSEKLIWKWWRTDGALMKIRWITDEELVKILWITDEELTNNWVVLQQLVTYVPSHWQNWTGQNNSFKSDLPMVIPLLSKLNLNIWLTAIQFTNCYCWNRNIKSTNSFWYRTIDISNKSIGVVGRGLGW